MKTLKKINIFGVVEDSGGNLRRGLFSSKAAYVGFIIKRKEETAKENTSKEIQKSGPKISKELSLIKTVKFASNKLEEINSRKINLNP